MQKITKAVIPCGGMGTRFLPITKTLPKEMLPVIDTPVLSYIVEEAALSGITDVLIIINEKKKDIKKYFSPDPELEDALLAAGKTTYLERLKNIYSMANINFEYQPKPLGSGDAVLRAKSFTGDQPFCLSWGDDLIEARPPVMSQLIGAFEKTLCPVVGVQRMDGDDIVKYGVAKVSESEGKLHRLDGIVEKPPLDRLPSRLASLGRYVLTPAVYGALEKITPGLGGELQFTDALKIMCPDIYAYEFDGKRYDMGDKFGSMQAITEFALKNDEIGDKYKKYLKELAKTL